MESAELSHYSDGSVEQSESVLECISAEMIDSGHDASIDFVREGMAVETEILDGEEVIMEGLPSEHDGNEELQVIHCEADDISDMLNMEPKRMKVDKDDPRSRLHYIKYLKKEGKPMKMWECGICGKEFRHQYTLMRHLPTHTDERNYKCEDCGKAFRQMSTLSQHRAIHSDARPYVCECCKKTFNRVSTLISHRKTHSDMKPHKCPICFKGFHQKGNLRNHVFTHTNERPYKCEVCEKGFNQMSNLVCHKAHVHGDKSRHVCTLCGNEFLRRYALRLHEEYNHGIVYRGGNRVQLKKSESEGERIASKKNNKLQMILPKRVGSRTNTEVSRGSEDSLTSALETKILPSSEVIIDPIDTKAMKTAKDSGQTTFALFKPAKGIPVLVKVMPAPNNKQMLVPATVEDLKSAGKITVSPNYDSANNGSPIKAVQIKVPVVATVIQRIGENGQLTISVESPGPEQAPDLSPAADEAGMEVATEEKLKTKAEFQTDVDTEISTEADIEGANVKTEEEGEGEPEAEVADVEDSAEAVAEGNIIHYLDEDGNVVAMDGVEGTEVQFLQNDGTILAAQPTVIMHPDGSVEPDNDNEHHLEEYVYGVEHGIMQMDTGGEVQLVRACGDGTYEVISEEEAALLMQSEDQTIEILDDNPEVQEMLEEGDDGQILVNQNNLSALVSAIRSSGYEVIPGNGQQSEATEENENLEITSDIHLNLEESGIVAFKMEDV